MKKYSNFTGVFQYLAVVVLGLASLSVSAKKTDYIGDIELKQVTMQDAVRILSELSGRNVIVTKDAADTEFSLFVRDASLHEAIDSMCRVTGLWYRKDADTDVYIVMTPEQFKEDVLVYRNESTKIFPLKHQNVVSAANAIQALFGNRVVLQAPKTDGSYQFDGDMGSGDSSQSQRSNRNNRNNRNTGRNNGQSSGQELSGGAQSLTRDLALGTLEQIGGRTVLKESDVSGLVHAAPIRVTYNSLHNLLLVRSSDENALRDIQQLIQEIDQPAKQVLLQMKIMRVSLGENEESVFDFQYTSNSTRNNFPSSATLDNPLGGGRLPDNLAGLGMKPDQLATGSLVFQVVKSDWLAKLAFLESENRTRLISTPLIMASNNKEAEIFIGEERPLVENVSSSGGVVADGVLQPLIVTTETTRKEIGTKLKIWPRINSDATVTLDIEQEISQINIGAATIPVATGGSNLAEYSIDTYNTTKLTLTAVAKNSQTIAIGGLIEERNADGTRGIPGVSSIPVLGDLLSSDEKDFSRSELVILIKPYIYDSVDLKGDGLNRVKEQLSFEENLAEVEEEASKALQADKEEAEIDLAKLEQVAHTLRLLLQNPEVFNSVIGIDWHHNDLMLSSLGTVEHNGMHFTKVLVNNQSRLSMSLNESVLGDYWSGQAWLFTAQEKEASIQGFGKRMAILVSDRPVEQVLNERKVSMRYVMTGEQ